LTGADRRERAREYADRYSGDYGFEHTMVRTRQNVVLELLNRWEHPLVIEIGCGSELLVERYVEKRAFERWIVVEPSAEFAGMAVAAQTHVSDLFVVDDFFESATDRITALCPRPPDVILCSSVLHEVADVDALLTAARTLLTADASLLHVNVPNALSLHRRLARTMGLIADEHQFSERNATLDQPRVFDHGSLVAAVKSQGFEVVETGGYFVKPFTHAQMEQLAFLDDRMVEGLAALGAELPELASEIYVNARPTREPNR
jgi:2-polyprenyl-3-methyl-5-hydroxy-6-metoxy-1,4-benzoquinol methylase